MPDINLAAVASMFPWTIFGLALAVSIGSIRLLAPTARETGWVDKPSSRKSHVGEIPLIGGWAVFLSVVLIQAFGPAAERAPIGYWVGALLLFVVAVIDDRRPIRARYRFLVQIAAAFAGLYLGAESLLNVGNLVGTGDLSAWWIVLPISIFGVVALINAVNFTDGADGLCGGLCFISLFWFVLSVTIAASVADTTGVAPRAYAASLIPLAAAVMGGLAGFLVFNLRAPWRRKASVFLGDSGSMLVGFTLAWFAIQVASSYGPASVSPVACLWIMAVPLADSASCIIRRTMSGATPMSADLKHLHHLLQRFGMTPGESVFAIHTSSFFCGLVGVSGWLLEVPEPWMFSAFAIALCVFVVGTVLLWRIIDATESSAANYVATSSLGHGDRGSIAGRLIVDSANESD